VFVTSLHFLLDRRRTELAGNLRNITEIFLEEVADGHDPTDPNVLWALSTDDDIVLLFLTSDGTVASRAGYFEVDAASIPDCVGKIVMHKEKNGLALLAKSMPVLINGEFTGNLMVVKRIDREYEFLEMLARLLLALNVCGALIALGVGKLASQKMLAPLSAIIRKARSIDSRSLHTRVELPREDDELRLLAQTLNDMLDRVEDAFARQGQFTQDASHELCTPLAALQGNAELLRRWGRDDPAVLDKCVAAICRQTEYMTHLTENLLFLTRGDHGSQALEKKAVDISRFLTTCSRSGVKSTPRIHMRRRRRPVCAYTRMNPCCASCSSSFSTTPPATRPPAEPFSFPSRPTRTARACPCATRAAAFRPTSWKTSSSASTAWIRRATARPAAPGWGSPLPEPSCACTAATSVPNYRMARPARDRPSSRKGIALYLLFAATAFPESRPFCA